MSLFPAATRLIGGAVVVIALAACGRNTVEPTPSPTPTPAPSPSPGNLTVTGTVLEFTGVGVSRPAPGVRLNVWRATADGGAVGATALPDVVSNASGIFTIADIAPGTLFFRTAPGSAYRFLCEAYPLFAQQELLRPPNIQLPVVHTSWSGTRPPQTWTMGTSFYGIVNERDGSGNLQPVAGATVDAGPPDPPATTDAQGFYMICSITGSDQLRTVSAAKTGYHTHTREHFFGILQHVVHFELTRK